MCNENIENKSKFNIFIAFGKRVNALWNKIWSNKLYPFLLLMVILFALFIFIMSFCGYHGGFFHINSDDILQYYTYVSGFFDKIKSGNLSLYDTNLLLGSSFYNGVYYIPIDPFTFIAFLLSFMMANEYAYCISFILRITAGAAIFYYVIARHMNAKAAFFGGLILFLGGMTEAYYIFPVYLGIVFYAPCGMLVVDLAVEKKKKWYLLIPLYTAVVVFYDFYIAYMLLAFLCFYFVVKNHIDNEFSLIGRNSIVMNGSFWISFLKFMAGIIIGLMISMVMLLPSALYIMNESSRNSTTISESLWYFSDRYKTEGVYQVSWKHYFQQLINIFMPNEPHRFCLVEAGDYVREHASLYITSGGLIFFTYFFFSNNKHDNRLKFWTVLFVVLLCIPAVSIVLGLNTSPYVRWFFIPYMFVLYSMCIGIDRYDSLKHRNIIKIFAMFISLAGVCAISFVLATKTELFFHYKVTEDIYYPILVFALVFNAGYLLTLIISFIAQAINKKIRVLDYTLPILIVFECIFAGVMIFANVDNTSSYYYDSKNEMIREKETLKTLGYNEKDGYRINLYTSYGRNVTNANVLVGNVNFGQFFQSFYNTPANTVLSDIYSEFSTSWSRNFNLGYSLLTGPIFNVKYVVSNEGINLPEEFYTKYTDNVDYSYYVLKADIPFIVYDKAMSETTYLSSTVRKQSSILYYAYIKKPGEITEKSDPYLKTLESSYKKVFSDYKINETSSSEVSNKLSSYDIKSYSTSTCTVEYDNYRVYDTTVSGFQHVLDNDIVMVWANDIAIRRQNDGYMYFREKNQNNPEEVDTVDKYGDLHQLHYNMFYPKTLPNVSRYTQLLVQNSSDPNTSSYINVYSFNKNLYTDFVNEQNQYSNKSFSIDGSKLSIKFTNPDTTTPKIIKTGYAYSDDWKVETEGYEKIVVDGSFLGIIVPQGVSDVNLTVKYSPAGFNFGLLISGLGIAIYLGICAPFVVTYIRKRRSSRGE